jgi:adenine-specific DNA-methyltransferase
MRKPVRNASSDAKSLGGVPIEATKHKDARVNIPTHELRDFVSAQEAAPQSLLFPRDPSLDPQLVWKGKDEQDRNDLAVPVVPIYIQEKIHPQALIENLRDTAASGEVEPELSLFADFNGFQDFEQKLDFYQYEGHWSNRMILGDSLLVMASLAEKEGLKGKVQCIYFDPPYGIKFGSNWQVSTRKREVRDGRIEDATRQPEQVRAFRDTWQLGIHSYLAYIRDRLVVSRELLTDTGSIFVQIGDENVHLVRSVLDEVFGRDCSVVTIVVKKKGAQRSSLIDPVNDYILWYSKTSRQSPGQTLKFRALFESWDIDSELLNEFKSLEMPDGTVYPVSSAPDPDGVPFDYRLSPARLRMDHPKARLFRSNPLTSGGERTNQSLPYTFEGRTYAPGTGNSWKHTARPVNDQYSGLDRLAFAGRLIAGTGQLRFKSYLDDFGRNQISNWWDNLGGASEPVYVVQTNPEIVQRCILMTTDPGDLVLDPTCGSGTTAFIAEHWGRRWITIDTSRVSLALARTRLMSARFPYFVLADSPAGILKEAEISGRVPAVDKTDNDIRKGFVYRRVAHVTSSTVANCAELRPGMSREQINAAIARNADTELLYDKPYEDNKCVRVTGPFTVESLSPHRVLSTDEERPESEADGQRSSPAAQFETMILDNLRKAGVQNTKKGERLVFETLDVHAGYWVNAAGTYSDASGKTRRVAVSIGPEHGTVGPQQVKEAAKEAVQGIGFDTLVVCGFAFDPHVSEEVKRYGSLTVLPVRMNPDLAMGDELLKKTGAGNLFMVFGEPDLDVQKNAEGKIVVEIRGLDVYDPTTGEIRSSSTDDIACWFIDTMYNGEAFFVRHAYFTGADEPYEKLQRALRAEIDEAAWQSLYSTVSRPFDVPETRKIAVKVINHYGDEVLKVIPVQ